MAYSKPPLTEALVEIRTKENVPFETLSRFDDLVKIEYPRSQLRFHAEGQFVIQESPTASIEKKPFSRMYFSRDEKHIFQATTNGIVLSRLAPYQSWSVFYPELQKVWALYKSVVGPKTIVRIAARYINQLQFQAARIEIEEYLKTYPEVSHDLPGELRDMASYALRIVIPQPDIRGVMVINQSVFPPANPETISIILDFDLYMDGLDLQDDDEIWFRLDQIRQRKNQYFEACITEKFREMIR